MAATDGVRRLLERHAIRDPRAEVLADGRNLRVRNRRGYPVAGLEGLYSLSAGQDKPCGRVPEWHGLIELRPHLLQCGQQTLVSHLLEHALDLIGTLPRLPEQALAGQVNHVPFGARRNQGRRRGDNDGGS